MAARRTTGEGFERKADAIADDLMARIVSGALVVGGLLPVEAELASHYGVSKSNIREAIKLLEVHGLVRPTRRLGTVVLDPLESTSPAVVRALLVRGGRIDVGFFEGWLKVRAVLDAEMCEQAAKNRTDADLAAIEKALANMRVATESAPFTGQAAHAAFVDATEQLGFSLARATHNPLYLVLARWNADVVRDLDHVFATLRNAATHHVAGVEILVDCVRRRQAAQARELVAAFHDWAIPRLIATARVTNGEDATTMLASKPSASKPSPSPSPKSKSKPKNKKHKKREEAST